MFITLLSSKHVEDNSVTNILLMNKENCALKLVDKYIQQFYSLVLTNFNVKCLSATD